jgi:hypothetical protein
VSTVQFHLSERTEGKTGRLALCLSSFTIVGAAQRRIEETSNVERLDRYFLNATQMLLLKVVIHNHCVFETYVRSTLKC